MLLPLLFLWNIYVFRWSDGTLSLIVWYVYYCLLYRSLFLVSRGRFVNLALLSYHRFRTAHRDEIQFCGAVSLLIWKLLLAISWSVGAEEHSLDPQSTPFANRTHSKFCAKVAQRTQKVSCMIFGLGHPAIISLWFCLPHSVSNS